MDFFDDVMHRCDVAAPDERLLVRLEVDAPNRRQQRSELDAHQGRGLARDQQVDDGFVHERLGRAI